MKSFTPKICDLCGKDFNPTGPASRYCIECAIEAKKKSTNKAINKYYSSKGRVVGIGKGNTNKVGIDDSQYKNGTSFLRKNRNRIREERRFCERCNKDLKEVRSYMWVVHHVDRNRSNNVDSNLELLCKRCHQLEHDCSKAFLKVRRSSHNGSRK